eukprot:c22903_g3_i1 orf=199-1398(+)
MGETQRRRSVRGTSPLQGESSSFTNIIIPGLPNEVALLILVRLPRALHGSFRCVCCAWRDALLSPAMSALRNTLHISEMWTLFLFEDNSIALYDPLLQHLSSPIPYLHNAPDCFVRVGGAIGNQLFFLQQSVLPADIRCFDITSMQWQSDSIPLWSSTPSFASTSAVVDGLLCVAGGGEDKREVGRFDVKSRRWEMMPKLREGRIGAVAVVLQGRLHVIGGSRAMHLHHVQSGEVWDSRSSEWMLEPELWPPQLHGTPAKLAVMMDTLYALRGPTFVRDMELFHYVTDTLYALRGPILWDTELFHYVTELRLWKSLGHVPLEKYACAGGIAEISTRLVGVGKELWVVCDCRFTNRTCTVTILSCVPSMGPSPLSWSKVPITSSFKFPQGCVTALNNVHV